MYVFKPMFMHKDFTRRVRATKFKVSTQNHSTDSPYRNATYLVFGYCGPLAPLCLWLDKEAAEAEGPTGASRAAVHPQNLGLVSGWALTISPGWFQGALTGLNVSGLSWGRMLLFSRDTGTVNWVVGRPR